MTHQGSSVSCTHPRACQALRQHRHSPAYRFGACDHGCRAAVIPRRAAPQPTSRRPLVFSEMRYDPRQCRSNPDNDRFVLSKGHAAPVLYAAWAEAGIIKRDELLGLRRFDSDLEDYPTPRLPWVEISDGIARARNLRRHWHRVECTPHQLRLPDVPSCSATVIAEGSVWEVIARCDNKKDSTRCAGSST